ncbi:syntaxin-18 [Bacillus rossius redtenbacheri]|uniref:syntaxin-18 n=1 Tax=Bacillus rossius redtenbacheri TaxID=93214 RepID=UPI002FDD500D
MDITTLFRACVKTIRTRNKAFGLNGEVEKTRLFKSHTKRTEFMLKAKEVLGQITRLRDFIFEHRKAYLNFASHLSDVPQMSDVERDKIDSGAQRIMNTCSHLIKVFKKESDRLVEPPQLKEHHKAVIELVESYLKTVCKLYSEQRAIRVKRAVEMQKLAKLEPSDIKLGKDSSSARISKTSTENKENEDPDGSVLKDPKKLKERNEDSNLSHNLSEDEQLSAEELQMFESENAQLYNELNSLSDEVKQIESKVVRIAELQEIFTEKVLEQEVDIDRISMTVIGSTENVKDANEQIRQAIQRNAGLRAWVLFFLLIMSFTLLFLDWYND